MKLIKTDRRGGRRAFTLIEMLVVIAIIGVLAALLIPAVQQAREAAARTQCANNMRQMGLALHNYLDRNKRFPTSGEGVNAAGTGTAFDLQSTFTLILPFMEGGEIYEKYDLTVPYNATPGNVAVAQTVIPSYMCPTNPARPASGRDSNGFAYCDYMPIAYTDINVDPTPGNLVRDTVSRRSTGALRLGGSTPGDITDGLSKTIAIMEDVGRSETFNTLKYDDPYYLSSGDSSSLLPAGTTKRNAWRWAEPDTGNGVSGRPGAKYGDPGLKIINNMTSPYGGVNDPTLTNGTDWRQNNVGVNDEPYSFHGGGCNALFMDGHVTFIRDSISPIGLRRLLTPNEGIPPVDGDY